MHSKIRLTCLSATLVLSTLLAGCGAKKDGGPGAGGMPPAQVSVVTIAPQQIAVTNELPGRLEATRVAQVRARVPGIVQQRVFKEGSDVKAGEVLFRIDPAPFQATYNSTEAALKKAEANLAQANAKLERYKPLVATTAISKQEYDDVETAQKQAVADVAAAKAAQESARLNLGYATVSAPISGRIGRALVTEGALVGQSEATPLAVVQQLDPVYVTLTQSTSELMRLQRALADGKLQKANGSAKVTLITEDGNVYPHAGKLLFSDLTVDESSGTVTLRAEFPNPQRLLLPGMYVRARLDQAIRDNAIVVPLQAVQRNPDGASVMVVGADDKVQVRPIKTAGQQNDNWIVSEGLKAGDRVIVEGLQKTGPGASVKPMPWQAPQNAGADAANPPAAKPADASKDAAPKAKAASAKPDGQNRQSSR
jgi:membrane fusion protein, multidrug efflux system